MISFTLRILEIFLYLSISIALLINRNTVHRVQIYTSEAYLNCNIDGDNNISTCVSDYGVSESFAVNASYVFGYVLLIGVLFMIASFYLFHLRHVGNIIINSIIIICITVICGAQELSVLLLLWINILLYEIGIYSHNTEFWQQPSTSEYTSKSKIFILSALHLINWGVIFMYLILYMYNSPIPNFIPLLPIFAFTHFIIKRAFHLKYYYGSVLGKFKNNSEIKGMVNNNSTRLDVIMKYERELLNHDLYWSIGIDTGFRLCYFLIYYLGTNNTTIRYI